MSKPRLLVVVAAGGSIDIGAPSTADLTQSTSNLDYVWVTPSGGWGLGNMQTNEKKIPFIPYVWSLICQQYKQPNFEHLYHAFEVLPSINRCYPRDTKKTVDEYISMPTAFLDYPTSNSLLRIPEAVGAGRQEVLKYIGNSFIDACSSFSSSPNWKLYVDFWQALQNEYDVTVITLNYDSAIEQASGLPILGFEPITGRTAHRFNPETFKQNISEPQVIHLHGSIHFGYFLDPDDPNRFVYEDESEDQYFYENVDEAYKTWAQVGRSHGRTLSGEDADAGPIITGLRKTDKLIPSPYCYYYSKMADLFIEIPRVLIIGYGFVDTHVNNVISRITRYHGDARRVGVITYKNFGPINHWTWDIADDVGDEELFSIAKICEMSRPPDPRSQYYSESSNRKCGIWYKGFKHFVENDGVKWVYDFMK